jgi:hypothetical protein
MGDGTATYVSSNWYYNGGNKYIGNGYATSYQTYNGQHLWLTAGNNVSGAGAAITFTQAMTLDASGNWMNGTTTAIGRATVVGGGTSQLAFHDGNGGSSNYGYLNYGGNSGELTLNANSSGGSTLIRFLTSNSGSNAERMRLDSSGNLLVGKTSTLVGAGSSYVEQVVNGTTGSIISLGYGGTLGSYLLQNSGSLSLQTYQSIPLTFGTGNTERARIDSSGNLLVGVTSAVVSNSNTTASATLAKAYNWLAVTDSNYVQRCDNTDGSVFQFLRGSSTVGTITITSSATAYNTSSDYRLKNITGPITTSGAYIDSLNPVEGTWKVDGSTFVGLIAHEVQEASRTNVATGVKDGEEMQGMDYSSAEIIANLIAEVKSLRKRLADAGIA